MHRRVPKLLVALLSAVTLACVWIALRLLVDGTRDVIRGGAPGVRTGALLALVAACAFFGLAWQLFRSTRSWVSIARSVARGERARR